MELRDTTPRVARRGRAGLNGAANQRAATGGRYIKPDWADI